MDDQFAPEINTAILNSPSTGERLPDLRLYKPRRGFRRILEVRT